MTAASSQEGSLWASQSQSPFFLLPRELRDEIYFHYVHDEEGYFYDPGSGKLRLSGGRAIDLALSYSCKAIAQEFEGVALRQNTVTFRTIEDADSTHIHAHMCWYHEQTVLELILAFARCFTPELANEFAENHAQTSRIVTLLRTPAKPEKEKAHVKRMRRSVRNMENFGESYAIVRDLRHELLAFIATKNSEFTKLTAGAPQTLKPTNLWKTKLSTDNWAEQLIEWRMPLWHIPTQAEATAERFTVGRLLPPCRLHPYSLRIKRWEWSENVRHFSAAAAAIKFLSSSSGARVRHHLRNITLYEDYPSVANPACHVQGLLPFLRENPKAHIHRQIEVWRSVLSEETTKFHGLWGSGIEARLISLYFAEIKTLSGHVPHNSIRLTCTDSEGYSDENWDIIAQKAREVGAIVSSGRRELYLQA